MSVSILGRNVDLKKAIGKTKQRSQMCLLATDDGRLVEVEIGVLKGCASQDDWYSAWLLDSENQMQDEKTGQWYQLLGERSTIPISLVKDSKVKDLKKLIAGIFHESWVMDLIQAGRVAAEEKAKTWLYIMLGTPVLLGSLILGIAVIKGGLWS